MTTRRTTIVIDALCGDCAWHGIGDDEQQVLRQADHHASTAHHLVSFNYERRVILDGSQPEFCHG